MAITIELNEWSFDEWLDSEDEQWFPHYLILYPLKEFVGKDVAYHFIAENETYHRVADEVAYHFIAESENYYYVAEPQTYYFIAEEI